MLHLGIRLIHLPAAAKYEGERKNGKRHGQGTYTFANGNKYVGEWKDDKFHGQGTFTWANGDQYIGEWKDSKKHGKGTKTYTDGSVEKGIWKNDLTIEDELLKIKELYEKGQITEKVYEARQISIMESYKH